MMRWIVVLVALAGLAACNMDNAPTPAPTPETTPAVTDAPDEWTQVSHEGVQLSIRTPDGWQSIENDYGILLAEHTDLTHVQAPDGILVYIFVPVMEEIDLAQFSAANKAWAMLDHITKMPDYVGHSTVSETVAFAWGDLDAAYYLLTDGDGNHTMVIAVVAPSTNRLVVCNISSAAKDAERIREIVPLVLSELTVNGIDMDNDSLHTLPDPLPFPRHEDRRGNRDATEEATEASW